MKQRKRTGKGASRIGISAASLEWRRIGAGMTYYMATISAADIGRSWNELRAYAKGAKAPITLGQWVNGTTYKVDLRVAVTASTMPGGFVLHFTVRDTSKSNGETAQSTKN